eukprot:gene3954-4940_t
MKPLITSSIWYNDDNNISRLLLVNEFGELFNLSINSSSSSSTSSTTNNNFSLSLKYLEYKVNPTSLIIDLKSPSNYFAFIGDICDGEILKLPPPTHQQQQQQQQSTPSQSTSSSQSNEHQKIVIPNHSGIIDFEVETSNLSTRIYACCSGASVMGSLKLIEKSLPTNQMGTLQISGTTGIWTLESSSSVLYSVISCLNSTIVYRFENGVADFWSKESNFKLDSQTIYSNSTEDSGFLIQVCPGEIVAFNPITLQILNWIPPTGSVIISACSRNNTLLVSLSKPSLLLALEIVKEEDNSRSKIVERQSLRPQHEISCIHLPSSIILSNSPPDQREMLAQLCVIGTYGPEILVVNYTAQPTMEIIFSFTNQLPTIPHSIALTQLSHGVNPLKIVVGLRDGSLYKWEFQNFLKENPFNISPYIKQISNSPVLIVPNLNQGALVLTDLPYYITAKKSHLALLPIKSTSLISHGATYVSSHSKTTFSFIKPSINSLSIEQIDFSKRMIAGGKGGNNSNNQQPSQEGILYFYSIFLNNEDIALNLENTPIVFKSGPVNSVLPLSTTGKYIVSAGKERYTLDFYSPESNNLLNGILNQPIPISFSRGDKIVLCTESNGVEIYKEKSVQELQIQNIQQNIQQFHQLPAHQQQQFQQQLQQTIDNSNVNNNLKKIGQESNTCHLADAVFISDDNIACVDKYGNFHVINYDPTEYEHDIVMGGDIMMNQQNVEPIVTMGSVANFSIRESCLRMRSLNSISGPQQQQQQGIMLASVLGSLFTISKMKRLEFEILKILEKVLVEHPLTMPLLNNHHKLYRSGMNSVQGVLDGDMISQFLYLDEDDQFDIIKYLIETFNINDYFQLQQQPQQISALSHQLICQNIISIIESLNDSALQ